MILNSIEDFARHVPTAVSLENFSDIETYVLSSELWLRNNILGTVLADEINATIDTGTIEGDDLELVALCQSIIANGAYYEAIPFLDLVHTNQGFAVISAANKVPASKERVDRLRESCLRRRDSEAETLISWLEAHSMYHDSWECSAAYSIISGCLIRSATELSQYAQWEGGRKEFALLKPRLLQDTMLRLEPVFSKDYIESLTERQADGDLTAADKKIIELLKYALGSLTTGYTEAAEKIISDALRYIDAHITDFPKYAASGEYLARAAGYENTAESPLFTSLF